MSPSSSCWQAPDGRDRLTTARLTASQHRLKRNLLRKNSQRSSRPIVWESQCLSYPSKDKTILTSRSEFVSYTMSKSANVQHEAAGAEKIWRYMDRSEE